MTALEEILGSSAGIRRLRGQLELILKRAATAPRPPSLLLRGETGTGKGLVARTIHRAGPRAHAPFVDLNCAAIPENLLEAELFGYERGAFTGANQAKPGLFQLAHRGMLFLDEIGTLTPALQAKLLKVLEEGVVRRLGATRAEPVDAWIVSATNEDLAEAMRARRFREDLYHRLALLSLELPPLRERGADILLLAERFLSRACADYGLPSKTFARDARAALAAYDWPGNVRELGNVIERAVLLSDESVVTAAMLALPMTAPVDDPRETEPAPSQSSREQMRAHLLEVLTETGWNISQTAVRLGVARNTILARMARFGLRPSAGASPGMSRRGGGIRRDAPAIAPADVQVPRVASSRAAWEQRRVALLRVDVVDASGAFDEMVGKVETFGGEIVELGRSAFVAAFGLDVVEDAPVRAALAALVILKARERAKSDDGAEPHAKIVVHVAQVLVGQPQGVPTIDLESKRSAWATIEALTGLDQFETVVVSEASAPFLERRFELTPASPRDASPVPFRRLTRREHTGFGLGGRPLSRFVGRDAELRLVSDRVADAARGRGQVVGIVGEPGVGKSRFVYELTRSGAMHDWRVLRCGGVSHGATTPWLPISELLRRYFVIDDADAPESIREKVAGTILSNREDLTSCLTPLLSLLDIAVDDPSWSRLDSSQQRQRIQDAMKRLLLQESRTQPLALIVEDLHWIDAGTQALLDGLIESLPAARLLLLVNYRPEYQHGWGTKTYYSQLRLDALAARTAGDLLRALLGDDPALTPLTRLLVERGNPLFIEESIQTFVETGALSGERGAYRLTRPIQSIEIPATVQMILAARIERLAADDKQLLQTASVIGKDIPVVLLHAVAGAPDDDVQRVLGRLRAAEFLYEARLFPDAEYTFKHALTHEVTYGTLLEERRKDLHARVVGAIERLHPDRLTEHVEELAHHAVRGELWETAVAYLHQAGLKALARSVNREAVSYFEQALAALGHLLATRETLGRAIDLRFDLKTALFPLGAFKRIIDSLREAEGLARTLDDQRRLGQLSVHMCHMLRLAGDATEAIAFGERARTIAESLGEISLQVTANLYLGAACLWTGDVPRAKALLLNVLPLLEHAPIHERFGLNGFPAVMARSQLTAICADRGEFTEGIAYGEEGIRLAESLDHPYSLVAMHQYLGGAQINRGGLHEAIRLFEHALALAREWHLTDMLAAGSGFLGYAYALVGRTGEGFPLLEQALRTMEATGHRANQSLLLLLLTEACVFANRPEDALEFAGRALTLARENGQGRSEAKALRLLADAAARRDPPEHAEGYYRDALALAEKLGMRPVVAHCRLGLGTMHARAGKRHEAQEHLVAATAMYREMDMPFWLERAEAARAELMNDPTTSGPRS